MQACYPASAQVITSGKAKGQLALRALGSADTSLSCTLSSQLKGTLEHRCYLSMSYRGAREPFSARGSRRAGDQCLVSLTSQARGSDSYET